MHRLATIYIRHRRQIDILQTDATII